MEVLQILKKLKATERKKYFRPYVFKEIRFLEINYISNPLLHPVIYQRTINYYVLMKTILERKGKNYLLSLNDSVK